MNNLLSGIRNWSEVWALLIPLFVIVVTGQHAKDMRPVVYYVCAAFVLNLAATVLYVFHRQMPPLLQNNNLLYNLHSVLRVLLFGYFIRQTLSDAVSKQLTMLPALYAGFVAVVFLFFDNPLFISTKLFAAENILLLSFVLAYFFQAMNDDSRVNWVSEPSFLVCTGIGLYEAVSFFIFLFYYTLSRENRSFGKITITIHNLVFVLFCLLLAVALKRAAKKNAA